LAQAFEALKTRLQAEGLFDAAHKKPLPFLPRRLALVTSPTGAVVRDFLRLQSQRHPNLEVLIYPVKVQGGEAAREISCALDELPSYPGLDVIVLARGGGSLEDLWPFNEELVARAIYRCPIPVVSAIGHEVDFTIADFVADVRAPTPSAAVELVAPDKTQLIHYLQRQAAALGRAWRQRQEAQRRHIMLLSRRLPDLRRGLLDLRFRLDEKSDALVRRARRLVHARHQHLRLDRSRLVLLSPRRAVNLTRQQLEQAGQTLGRRFQRGQAERRRVLDIIQTHLYQLNPLAILKRGYAIATLLPAGTIIRDASQVPLGAEVRVKVARGRLDCEVFEVSE
jgi:exodeoxyribonuclease VII large subunit